MRVRHLEVFHAVMQTGSITRAASLLNISQPAASKMLGLAERELGIELFTRLPGGLKPTPEAHILFEETKQLHSTLGRIRQLTHNLRTHPGGLLRIGCIPSLGLNLVPRAIASFNRQFPDVAILLRTQNNQSLSQLLLAHELDIAFAFEPVIFPGVTVTEVGRARAAYVGKAIPGQNRSTVRLDELPATTWIRLDSDDPLGALIAAAVPASASSGTSIQVKTHFTARALAECGVGFTVVDEYSAQSPHEKTSPVFIDPPLSIGICSMTAESQQGTRAAQLFLQHFTQQLTPT